jgi:hypothetical protein
MEMTAGVTAEDDEKALNTSTTSAMVPNQSPTPITARKFMRKLSFVNQSSVSHVSVNRQVSVIIVYLYYR